MFGETAIDFFNRDSRDWIPGTLHHVRGRGIEAKRISRTKKDRGDFVDRLAELSRSGRWAVNAWALMQFVSSIKKKNDES